MDEEVDRHRIMRDSLEMEIQALRQRLLTVESYAENRESEHSTGERPAEDQLSRSKFITFFRSFYFTIKFTCFGFIS